ncbi:MULTISPECIES: exonuclease domain-containing protein [Hyphomicrobiales]|jgi:exodeoxyribonuclease-1|uniref:exonuclease domain-containing protein n=1 Tax=Methylobacterium sp. CCH7-A2 TaxID=1768789 RepID=UPI000829E469|nr:MULTISPECIES: exonuclease domain-containing protein [Hyphomicrobiales]
MTTVIYDTETTGLSRHYDVPLQGAFIVCDDDLVVQDEIVLRGRPPQHVIPSPDALLTTRTTPAMLDGAPLSHLDLMQAIASVVSTVGPARWVGYNSLKFDETILRQGFLQTLHPVYATQAPGCTRADVMVMAQAIAAHEPWALAVPLNEAGKPTFRLGPLCAANGIVLPDDEAHDALADARATLAILRHLREAAPATFAMMTANSDRRHVLDMLRNIELLALTQHFGASRTLPIAPIVVSPTNGSAFGVADLTVDPGTYLERSEPELAELLAIRGPRPIFTIAANAQPMLFPVEHGGAAIVDPLSMEQYKARAKRIRADQGFVARLTAALGRQFSDRAIASEPEEQIYDRFVTKLDQAHSRRWHEIAWEQRDRFGQAVIGDPRLQAFSRRLVFEAAPATMTATDRAAMTTWLVDRLLTHGERPWMTIPAARRRLVALRGASDPGDVDRLRNIADISAWLDAKSALLDAVTD